MSREEESLLGLGFRLLEGARWEDARQLFEGIVVVASGNALAWSGLGRACLAMHDLNAAIQAFGRAMELQECPEHRLRLGEALMAGGQQRHAKAVLERIDALTCEGRRARLIIKQFEKTKVARRSPEMAE